MSVIEAYLREHTDRQKGVNFAMILAQGILTEKEAMKVLDKLIDAGKVTVSDNAGGPYYRYKQERSGWRIKDEEKARAARIAGEAALARE